MPWMANGKTGSIAEAPPSAAVALGVCGLLFALYIGSNEKGAEGFAVAVGVFFLGGVAAKKSPDQLAAAQASWDKRWMCARCGHQWES